MDRIAKGFSDDGDPGDRGVVRGSRSEAAMAHENEPPQFLKAASAAALLPHAGDRAEAPDRKSS